MEVKDHIILFLDILGYKKTIESCKDKAEENLYLEKEHGFLHNLADYIKGRNHFKDENGKYDIVNLSRFKYMVFF